MINREKQEYLVYKNNGAYDHKGRWLSYYYQYKRVISKNFKNVLEVGIGNGTTSHYLRTMGYNLTTVDYEAELKPDIVADVVNLPFPDKQFDVALCCEVLEHLPFEEFDKAVGELLRVSNYLYLTVPDHRRVLFACSIKLPFINEKTFSVRVPRYFTKHAFDGFHYWEIGKKDYPLKKIIKAIESTGNTIIHHGSPYDVPLVHYFFIESKEAKK